MDDIYVTKLRGIERDTPEYFAAVEREVGLRGRDDDDGGDDGHAYEPAPTRSPTTSASSSTSRSSPAYAAPALMERVAELLREARPASVDQQ